MNSDSAVPGLNRNNAHAIEIRIPPLSEQRAIAEILDAIDESIESAEAVIAATEQVRDSLLHEMLTRGMPGWHTEWRDVPGIGTIPAAWEVVRLGEVAEVRSGFGFPTRYQGNSDGDYAFIKVSDMNLSGNEIYIRVANNYVSDQVADELGAGLFPTGTIVFPKVGAAIATNKKRVLYAPTIIDNNMMGVTVRAVSRCYDRFLHNWFLSIDLVKFSNVSAVPSITGSRMKSEYIPLPSLIEQCAIAELLEGVESAIVNQRTELDLLQLFKTSTANALLTGQVRVGKEHDPSNGTSE